MRGCGANGRGASRRCARRPRPSRVSAPNPLPRLRPARAHSHLTCPPADLRVPPAEPMPVPTDRPDRDHLEHLQVRAITVVYDDGTVGIDDVSFDISRGELVIVTGPIAA